MIAGSSGRICAGSARDHGTAWCEGAALSSWQWAPTGSVEHRAGRHRTRPGTPGTPGTYETRGARDAIARPSPRCSRCNPGRDGTEPGRHMVEQVLLVVAGPG